MYTVQCTCSYDVVICGRFFSSKLHKLLQNYFFETNTSHTNDVLGNLLLVAEESLVVLEGGEVAIHHLRMVPHPDSKPPAECGKSI
jgi:hypothetical protein